MHDDDSSPLSRTVIALMLLGVVARWVGITHESLWLDEGFSVHLVTADDFWTQMRTSGLPPGFFLLLDSWSQVFGGSVGAMRSLCALASTLALLGMLRVIHNLGRDRVHPETVMAIYAVAPFLCWYAQELRPYSLLELGFVVMLAGLTEPATTPRAIRNGLLFVGALVAGAFHYFSLLAVGTLSVVGWFLRGDLAPRRRLRLVGWAWLGIVPVIPVYVLLLRYQMEHDWGSQAHTSPAYLVTLPLRVLWAQTGELPAWLPLASAAALAGCALGVFSVWRDSERRRLLLACVIGFVAPVIALLAAAQVMEPRLTARYLIFAAPLVAVVLGVTASGLPRHLVSLAMVAVVVTLGAMRVWIGTHEYKDGYRQAALSIEENWRSGDLVCPVTAMPEGFGAGGIAPYLRYLEQPVRFDMAFEKPVRNAKPAPAPPAGQRVHLVLRWRPYSEAHIRKLLADPRLEIRYRGPRVRDVEYVLVVVRSR